ICLEISKFWVSITQYNSELNRYEIKNVVGPDEFHTGYPGEQESGIHNNAYTNFMASWAIRKSIAIIDMLSEYRKKELMELLEISDNDLQHWRKVSSLMFIPFHANGIISQFEGYEYLEDLDWNYYRNKFGNIQRLDRILEAEGKSANNYKIN